jgi:hypothetical protein
LTKELDLISILDSIRKANILSSLLLKKDQQVFIENQPHFILGENTILSKFDYPKSENTNLKNHEMKNILSELASNNNFDINDRFNTELISNIVNLEAEYKESDVTHVTYKDNSVHVSRWQNDGDEV